MTGSSPADLAVTFRSIDRRLREALRGRATPDDEAAAAGGRARRASSTGRRPQSTSRRGRRGIRLRSATAIATAIERVPANDWDGARLERLRSAALDAGRLLRTIAELDREDS